MANPKFSDEEFINLWNQHLGAKKVAEITGISERNTNKRRRNIERRHDIRLRVFDSARPKYNTSPVNESSRAVIRWNIENGVVLVGSDAHVWPGELTTAQRAFIYFAKHFAPAPVGIIANGDMFDGARISRFPMASFMESGKPSVKHELEAVQAFLGEIEKNRRGARLLWPLGNHDLRYEARLAAQVPEFEGIGGFHLKDHFHQWTPCWRIDINDEVVIKHRWHNGIHAVYNNTVKSGKTMVTGHLHSLKVTPWSDYNGTRYGVDTGCLADTDSEQTVHYTEAGPVNWRSGFAVLTFKNGKLLVPELVQKHDKNHVEFRGQLIAV